jgi:hypothetical protein
MEWTVWVIKPYGITTGSWVTVLRTRKGTLYLIYSLYQQAACRIWTYFSRDFLILLKMQHRDVLCVKQARVLSRNEIRKIVMVSDSDEDKHYASKESEDEGEPRPPLWRCSISRPPSPIATRPAVKHGSRQIKLFFHLLDQAIVNSCLLLSACGGKKISHRDFWLTLIREMLAWAGMSNDHPCL